jgi:hypothetical protein
MKSVNKKVNPCEKYTINNNENRIRISFTENCLSKNFQLLDRNSIAKMMDNEKL